MHAEKLHAEKQFFDVIQITNRVTLLARKSSATRKTSFRFASRYLYPSPRQLGGKTEERSILIWYPYIVHRCYTVVQPSLL